MKKILIIFLALIAWGVIGWFATYKVQARAIQADIKQRASDALIANNLTWAKVDVDGRDVIVSGIAPSQQYRQYALQTVNVNGANSVKANILLQGKPVLDQASTKLLEATPIKSSQPVVAQIPAYPYSMDVVRDKKGQYIFTGIVSTAEFQSSIEQHLTSIGAKANNVVWNVKVSSATPPSNWTQHVKDSVSALQFLTQGRASFGDGKALLKGDATSQHASKNADSFAQLLTGDYETDILFNVVENVSTVVQSSPLVGSSKYAALSCQTEFNRLLKNEKIQFQSGSATLQESSLALLINIAKGAGRCPTRSIHINGYTDANGREKDNKILSQARAEAVKSYLVSLGLKPTRLYAQGFGAEQPVATNETEDGRIKNRRIELIVEGLI